MIHPINIPDDLLAANPQRPQFIPFDKKSSRPKLTYTPEGRRLREGIPVSPKSPQGLWKDFFLRSFVHRIACDAQGESAEVSSTDSIIDVVDLQPKTQPAIRVTEDDDTLKLDRASTDLASDSDEDSDNSFSASARLGTPGRLPVSRQRSVKISRDVVRPILAPCCSKSELSEEGLKEFLRLDFSHLKCFNHSMPSEDNDASEQEIVLVANDTGSRIWVKDEKEGRCCRQKNNELRFYVSSVRVQPNAITVKLHVHQLEPSSLKVVTHVHSATGEEVGSLLRSTESALNGVEEETEFEVCVDGVEGLVHDLGDGQYLVLTLLGKPSSRSTSS